MIWIRRNEKVLARMAGILLLGLFLPMLVTGCDRGPKEERLGFIGGLSDRNVDIGQSGYKGVVLAVEQVNRASGINGQILVLDPKDDSQNKDTAAKAAEELAAAKVDAVIGPFTSAMAAAVLPVLNRW